jgi:hypothetical protein
MGLSTLDEGGIGDDGCCVETFGHGEYGVVVGYFGFIVCGGVFGAWWWAVVVAGVEVVEPFGEGTGRRWGYVSSHCVFFWLLFANKGWFRLVQLIA